MREDNKTVGRGVLQLLFPNGPMNTMTHTSTSRAHLDLPECEGLGMPVHPRLPQWKQPVREGMAQAW